MPYVGRAIEGICEQIKDEVPLSGSGVVDRLRGMHNDGRATGACRGKGL